MFALHSQPQFDIVIVSMVKSKHLEINFIQIFILQSLKSTSILETYMLIIVIRAEKRQNNIKSNPIFHHIVHFLFTFAVKLVEIEIK